MWITWLKFGRELRFEWPRIGNESTPLDAWWHVQDLLWRLHARQAIEVLPLAAAHVVRLRHAVDHPESTEVQALLDPRVDAWRDGTTVSQLIVHRDFAPEGLCLHFASAARIARWPEGPALLDQMTVFFNLLPRNNHDQQRATA
jgi:hypothetical protein